ncbi:MAG: type 2 lantibiotic biosynthesis protein LanM, partial [Phenylobacterium sp.]
NQFLALLDSELDITLPAINAEGVQSGDLLRLLEPLMQSGFKRLQSAINQLVLEQPQLKLDVDALGNQFYQQLVTMLASITGRTVVLELHIARLQGTLSGDTPEARLADFVRQLAEPETRQRILTEYPVLARLALQSVDRWLDCSLELLSRLATDWTDIEKLFSPHQPLDPLSAVQGGAGDPHRDGRSVAILTFGDDLKIVYKPRSVETEVVFGQLLGWCNQQGFNPEFAMLKVLSRQSYGWVEFARHQSCTDPDQLRRFYLRQGGLLALMYLLDANDFHYENIVAAGEYPMPVDLETMFHPVLEMQNSGEQTNPAATMHNTVLRTGLLPRRLWTNDGDRPGIDLSGLAADGGEQYTPDPVLVIEKAGTDEMHYARKRVKFPGAHNLPNLGGKAVNASDYSDDIAAGFDQIYRLVLKHQQSWLEPDSGPLAAFAKTPVRVVARETQVYGHFLMESLHSDFMGNALERERFFDQLWIIIGQHPWMAALVPFEIRDLQQMDVPLFTTTPDSVDLYAASGEKIANVFAVSSMQRVRTKISTMTEQDNQRQQWIIHSAMRSVTLANRAPEKSAFVLQSVAEPAKAADLINASEQIASRIAALAFRTEQDACWFSWKSIGNSHWDLEPMSPVLYDGLAGIALYLAYLGKVTDSAEQQKLARETLITARYLWREYPSTLNGIGAFSGWAGPIYLLTHLGVLWQDEALLDEAVALADTLGGYIDEDEANDVVSGGAGAIIVLLNLYSFRPSAQVLAIANRCADQILKRAIPMASGLGWVLKESGTTPLVGMSHGTAGIAWALSALGKVTGRADLNGAAQQALAYERSQYSTEQQNWPDLRHGERPETTTHHGDCFFLTAWCHGAPGIGLARLAMRDSFCDSAMQQEIEDAIETTCHYGFNDNHSMCHGALGNLDLLLSASQSLERPQLLEQAEQLAGQILAGIDDHGWITGLMYNLETPGLMVGLSGMGYQLLRLAHPDQVPSVLALQPPILP